MHTVITPTRARHPNVHFNPNFQAAIHRQCGHLPRLDQHHPLLGTQPRVRDPLRNLGRTDTYTTMRAIQRRLLPPLRFYQLVLTLQIGLPRVFRFLVRFCLHYWQALVAFVRLFICVMVFVRVLGLYLYFCIFVFLYFLFL